MKINNKNMI